jgi:excisionase family DNA binding protein
MFPKRRGKEVLHVTRRRGGFGGSHEAPLAPVDCIPDNKNPKTVELASPDRKQVVTMKCGKPLSPLPVRRMADNMGEPTDERPWNVHQAARFLGVSPQTVYLWVERKQIPHLRIMGRNIRFLRPDLDSFRATFRQELKHT